MPTSINTEAVWENYVGSIRDELNAICEEIGQDKSVTALHAVRDDGDDSSLVCVQYQHNGRTCTQVSLKPTLHEQLRKYPDDAEEFVVAMNGETKYFLDDLTPAWHIAAVQPTRPTDSK